MRIEELYKLYLDHPQVTTDTRKVKSGDFFFALKGPKFNGNSFARQAIEAGAVYAVIDESSFEIPGKTILVDDVLSNLQQLAKYHRQQLSIPFLAITGTNGKTTSKELVHAVLSTSFKTYTTQGNLNNHIGIPLTILSIRKDAEIAVIEMGANHLREIAGYCTYTLPTHAVITNCGKAHLEGFGSVEGVRKAKGELYDFIRAEGGTVFAMWDYDYLREMSKGVKNIIRYGTKDADVIGTVVGNDPYLQVSVTDGQQEQTISSKLVGEYNLPNILLAVAIGKHFGVSDELIRRGIENYQPSNSRSQMIEKDSNKIILDAYNANPSSMKLAIENFAHLQAENKILILGGMAELGADSLKEHQELLDLIKKHKWRQVVLVGGDFKKLAGDFLLFNNSLEAKAWYQEQQFKNSYILIKGSRSMQMENIIE
jgi:UDP-N-acetylmuramoyl-tripeptide--D-alanyl-D-alanine ligase